MVRRHAVWTVVALLASAGAAAQGTDDLGHPSVNGNRILGAWNPNAGRGISDGDFLYPEDQPNIDGWDYRINFPYTYTRELPGSFMPGAGVALVGVVEDTSATGQATLSDVGHVNNSLYLFGVNGAREIQFKQLPSRRSYTSGAVENVETLLSGYVSVGSAVGVFSDETPAVTVVGQGIGTATLYVAARGADGSVRMSSRLVDTPNLTSWSSPWAVVAASGAVGRLSVAQASNGRVVVAWATSAGAVMVRQLDPALGLWGPAVQVAAGSAPELLWDGSMLHLFFIGPAPESRYLHARAASGGISFESPARTVGLGRQNVDCDVALHNQRFHATCASLEGAASGTAPPRLWYSTSVTTPAAPSAWSPRQWMGLNAHSRPVIGAVGHAIYIVATSNNASGRLEYARKDPHVLPYEWTGGSSGTDQWLEVGTPVRGPTNQSSRATSLYAFNHDLYLGLAISGSTPRLGNFSRAALKQLISSVPMTLVHGSQDPRNVLENDVLAQSSGGEFLVGDVNNDGRADLVRGFPSSTGGAVRAALTQSNTTLAASTQWHATLARTGDTLLLGDVNADGRADFVSARTLTDGFAFQVSLSNGTAFAAGSDVRDHRLAIPSNVRFLLGDVSGDGRPDLVAVERSTTAGRVWVAVGNGSGFGGMVQWLTGFATSGQTPLLGDFNGDGRKDLVLMAHTAVSGVGDAPVWVALSNGTAFASKVRWSADFVRSGQTPLVADFNLDGRDDLVAAVRGTLAGERARRVYVAFSSGTAFPRDAVVISTFADSTQTVLVGNFSGLTRRSITGAAGDERIKVPTLHRITPSARRVEEAALFFQIPFPVGAPWENYRFFTEKGLGVAAFPDSFWDVSCVSANHQFALLGAAGSGGGSFTQTSVRPGGAEGHILEELGHSVFANCIRQNNDRLGFYQDIFVKTVAQGGFESDRADSCDNLSTNPTVKPALRTLIESKFGPGSVWIDCRDPEHFFLGFLKPFRLKGEVIRGLFDDPTFGPKYQKRYEWIRDHWFQGVEYHLEPGSKPASRSAAGLECLYGQCPFPGVQTAPRAPVGGGDVLIGG